MEDKPVAIGIKKIYRWPQIRTFGRKNVGCIGRFGKSALLGCSPFRVEKCFEVRSVCQDVPGSDMMLEGLFSDVVG